MERELSKHQSASCLIVAFVIARFASLSCDFSAKTRIRPLKLYQINESFCSRTRCVSLHLVYSLVAVSTCFSVSGAPSLPIEFATLLFFEPEPEPAFESHFRFFNRVFPSHFCTRYYCTHPSDLQESASPI